MMNKILVGVISAVFVITVLVMSKLVLESYERSSSQPVCTKYQQQPVGSVNQWVCIKHVFISKDEEKT